MNRKITRMAVNPYTFKTNPKEWEAWESGYKTAMDTEVEWTRAQWSCGHFGWLICAECFDWKRLHPKKLSPFNLNKKAKK